MVEALSIFGQVSTHISSKNTYIIKIFLCESTTTNDLYHQRYETFSHKSAGKWLLYLHFIAAREISYIYDWA